MRGNPASVLVPVDECDSLASRQPEVMLPTVATMNGQLKTTTAAEPIADERTKLDSITAIANNMVCTLIKVICLLKITNKIEPVSYISHSLSYSLYTVYVFSALILKLVLLFILFNIERSKFRFAIYVDDYKKSLFFTAFS